jgi:hypothetical protein
MSNPSDSIIIQRNKIKLMANKIIRTYKKYKLNKLCPNIYDCISFGQEITRITNYFDFSNFTHTKLPFKKLESSSGNGIIFLINNVRNGLTATSIMKTAGGTRSDNLLYEYIVGLFINQVSLVLPCFIQTYDIYYIKDYEKYKKLKTNKKAQIINQRPASYFTKINYNNDTQFCKDNEYLALLIEYISSSSNIREEYKKNPNIKQFELLCILLQVYLPLSKIAYNYTHYDLHHENVLLYKLSDNTYYEYVFYYTDERGVKKEIKFKTQYIVKIIDYGRSYFKYLNDNTNNSEAILKFIQDTQTKECKNYNGHGLGWLYPRTYSPCVPSIDGCINSGKSNISHDLRFAYYIFNAFYKQKFTMPANMPNFMKLLVTSLKSIKYEKVIGTFEQITPITDKIVNVIELAHSLEKCIDTREFIDVQNQTFLNFTNVGTLNVDGNLINKTTFTSKSNLVIHPSLIHSIPLPPPPHPVLNKTKKKGKTDLEKAEKKAKADLEKSEKKAKAELEKAEKKAKTELEKAEKKAKAELEKAEKKAKSELEKAEKKAKAKAKTKKNTPIRNISVKRKPSPVKKTPSPVKKTPSPVKINSKRKRCPNGTRKNKITGLCEVYKK